MTQLPEAFLAQLKFDFPEIANKVVEGINSSAPTSIQVNRRKLPELNLPNINWNNLGYYLKDRPAFVSDPLYHAGCYYPMEASSMFVGKVIENILSDNQNPLVLDLCAAPGGKSISILNRLNGRGFIVANEIHAQRSNILKENLIKWGHPNILITNNSPEDFLDNPALFDVVMVDAPCSGEGMFRKDEIAIQEWSENNVSNCLVRQKNILETAIELIKPNGYLIYSTCTFNKKENEEQVLKLLATNSFEVVKIPLDNKSEISESNLGYRFFPGIAKGEGFACFILKKLSSSAKKTKPQFKVKQFNIKIDWFKENQSLIFHEFKEDVFAISNFQLAKILDPKKLHIKQLGIQVAQLKGKLLLPHPNLIFLVDLTKQISFPLIEVKIEEAHALLCLETISVTNNPKGWIIFTYNNLPFALGKNVGNRINNYFPKNFKIRIPKNQLSNFSVSNFI